MSQFPASLRLSRVIRHLSNNLINIWQYESNGETLSTTLHEILVELKRLFKPDLTFSAAIYTHSRTLGFQNQVVIGPLWKYLTENAPRTSGGI